MIEFKHVSRTFNNRTVLEDISFTVEPGQITCLIGPNGSGKTTLMNLLMKLVPLESGEITLDGKPITVNDFNRVNYIPDLNITLKNMTIQQAIEFMAAYYTVFNHQKASEILEFFELKASDRIGNLSKGNIAKVNILLGLALDTDYILMDEPFSGIDVFTREEIAAVFTSKLIDNQGVLISTHDINDIEFLIDKAVLLKQGRVMKEFQPEIEREETGRSIIDVMREEYRR